MNKVVIVGAFRSAIGSFGASLAVMEVRNLGAQVLAKSIKKSAVKSNDVEKLIVGNVLSAGLGQNIARQIALDAGLNESCTAMTINQVCGSGLQSVILAAQSIQTGETRLLAAGGIEIMSRTPYVLPTQRWGSKMGHTEVIDTMISDGLWDAFDGYHMGITAEHIAQQWNISREEQDAFANDSQMKAIKAQDAGMFEDEIVAVHIPQRKGEDMIFDRDEYIKKDTNLDKLARLKPAFLDDGTVTAGNASGINDGAAFLILAEEKYAMAEKLDILGEIRAYDSTGLSPRIMGYGPARSIKRMLSQTEYTVNDIERYEINEAFAAQSIAVIRDLNINKENINVYGGAIALGHPIGASGARILTTLLHTLKREHKETGIASLCVGGGMGTSVLIHRGTS